MNKLVIVGCGRLAEIITNAVVKGMLPDYELVGVYSRTASKAERIANKMRQYGKMCAACYKPQNKMFHFCKTFCSKITLVNTIQNVI